MIYDELWMKFYCFFACPLFHLDLFLSELWTHNGERMPFWTSVLSWVETLFFRGLAELPRFNFPSSSIATALYNK